LVPKTHLYWHPSRTTGTMRRYPTKVVTFLKEYVDLLPQNFLYMKGIKGELGEMRIELKPDAKPINKRPYRLNLRRKERVK